MKAHIKTRGTEAEVECESIKEGENGVMLYEGVSTNGVVIGYVPYDGLEYIEPSEES